MICRVVPLFRGELMVTQEQKMALTEQEQREADAFCDLWQSASEQERALAKLQRDMEDVILKSWSDMRSRSNGVNANLRDVVNSFGQIADEVARHHRYIDERIEKSIVMSPTPPQWFKHKINEMLARTEKIMMRNRLAAPVISLLVDASVENNLLPPAVATFFKACIKSLDELDINLKDAQKTLRDMTEAKVEELRRVRDAASKALCVWASASQERYAYLKEKGVGIVVNFSQPLVVRPYVPIAEPVKSLRRKKKENAKTVSVGQNKPAQPAEEQPWQIICVNRQGTILGQTQTLISGSNGENLSKLFDEQYGWAPNGLRTIRVLRKLVNTSPCQRLDGAFRVGELTWNRLKVGRKYRILARVKDDSRTIFVMAGHRTRLYASIDRNHDES